MTRKEFLATLPKYVINYPKKQPRWVWCSPCLYDRYLRDNGKVVVITEIGSNGDVAVKDINTGCQWAWVSIRALKLFTE